MKYLSSMSDIKLIYLMQEGVNRPALFSKMFREMCNRGIEPVYKYQVITTINDIVYYKQEI